MKFNRTIATKLAIVYIVAFASLAQAKSGEVTTNNCVSGEILSSTEIAPKQSIMTFKYLGVVRTVPSGRIIDLASYTCQGTISSGETKVTLLTSFPGNISICAEAQWKYTQPD